MAVTLHPSGNYRAYKKVGGKEFQYYASCREDAEKKQEEFNSIASLMPKQVFSSCGRLKGCRVSIYRRKGRKPVIIGRILTGPYRQQRSKEIRYNGDFEELWDWLKERWKEYHNISITNLGDYFKAIKRAKQLYIRDLEQLEIEINQ